jgi:heat shock protein HtpX
MATLYSRQSSNVTKTWLLMAVFLAVIVALGYFFSVYYDNPGIFYFAFLFSLFMNVLSYWFSDSISLSLSHARPASREEFFDLYTVTENLSITAGLPMPKLYVIDDPAPNAFATGRNKNHAAVAATTGLLQRLDRTELEGVIAHELSHIGNKDTLLMTTVVVLVGLVSILSDIFLRSSMFRSRDNEDRGGGALVLVGVVLAILSPIIATLIKLAISRKREFLADASGALLTRYPEGLASALRKISSYGHPMQTARTATAHLFIANPFGADSEENKEEKVSWIAKLFMTHPPVQERISALLGK